jgi:hypothetical protein
MHCPPFCLKNVISISKRLTLWASSTNSTLWPPCPLCDAFSASRSFSHGSRRVHPSPLVHEPLKRVGFLHDNLSESGNFFGMWPRLSRRGKDAPCFAISSSLSARRRSPPPLLPVPGDPSMPLVTASVLLWPVKASRSEVSFGRGLLFREELCEFTVFLRSGLTKSALNHPSV